MWHLRHRTPKSAALLLAAAAVLLSAAPGTARASDIRSAEWPLDPAHFDATRLWTVSRGNGVLVAVIDSGVQATHPDLKDRIEPGTSLLGNQGDGRTDESPTSHGTAIAGIIAATGGPDHNGMTGLAPDARILPVKAGTGELVAPQLVARGITWAVDHGAKVVNVSSGLPRPDALLRQAVDYAAAHDVIVVASAGNSGRSDNLPQYPASFPGVLSVAGTNPDGSTWEDGQHGTGISIAAPASGIYSTNDQDGYVQADGTSYAAAYVSATAALIRARYPSLTAGQVVRRIIDTAAQHHSKPDPRTGYGILDPHRALADPAPFSEDRTNPLVLTATAPSPQRTSALVWVGAGTTAAALAAGLAGLWRHRRKSATSEPSPAPGPRKTGRKSTAPATPARKKRTR